MIWNRKVRFKEGWMGKTGISGEMNGELEGGKDTEKGTLRALMYEMLLLSPFT